MTAAPSIRPAASAAPTARIPIALYPTGLALVLVAELVNVGGTSPFAALRSWLVVAVASLLLATVARILLGDKHRGGVLAALWVIALLGGDDVRFGAVILAATALMLAERYLLAPERRTIRWWYIGRWATRLTGIVALAVLIQAIQMGTLADAARSVTHETFLRSDPVGGVADPEDPDIYMVLLDGHTRADVARDILDQPEDGFIATLEADGFTVADRSRSNYTNTSETLSSMFNAEHLADLEGMRAILEGKESRPPGAVVREAINDSRAVAFLHDRGYEIETVASGWEQVTMREADHYVDGGQINEFEIGVLRRSLVGHLLEQVAPDAVSQQQRERIDGVLTQLAGAPSRMGERPRFVFAHVPSPHPPWVYHADGSPRTVATLDGIYGETPATMGLSDAELAEGYAGQLAYIDGRMLETLGRLDAAIAERGRPSVVILFSDHGTWVGADNGDIRLRFKNLLAVRSTDAPIPIRRNETLVNLLPTVFGALFDADWERQPDTEFRIGPRDVFDLREVDDPDASAGP